MTFVSEIVIFKYLDNTYAVDLDSLEKLTVVLKTENRRISIAVMYDDLKEMFDLHSYSCGGFFNEWIDKAALTLNNEMVDDMYGVYSTRTNTF